MSHRHFLNLLREARTAPNARTPEGRLLHWCLAMEARLIRSSRGTEQEVCP